MYIDLVGLSLFFGMWCLISLILDKQWKTLFFIIGVMAAALAFVFGTKELSKHIGGWTVIALVFVVWFLLISKKDKEDKKA